MKVIDEPSVITYYTEDGLSATEIATLMGTTSLMVYKILRKNGVTVRRGPRAFLDRLTPEDIDELTNDYNSGMSMRDIVKKWGVSICTVYDTLDVLEVPRRPFHHHAISISMLDEACRLYVEGATNRDILRDTGVNIARLQEELDRRGIPLKSSTLGKAEARRRLAGLPPIGKPGPGGRSRPNE